MELTTASASNPLVTLTFLLITLYGIQKIRSRSNLKSIPGPPGLPLLGNLFDWPGEYQAETVNEWKKAYGPMIKLGVFGKRLIFLASGKVISDLFAKRSSVFSDRPVFTFAGELCGLNSMHPTANFGDDFRQQRKLMKEVLAGDVLRRHENLLDEEGKRMLASTLKDPQGFDRHLRRFSSSLSLRMVYGFEALEVDDPHVLLAEEMMQITEHAVIAGWAVDFLPWLKHIPRWFPGASFKKKAEYIGAKIEEMISTPFQEVRDAMVKGPVRDSFVALHLGRLLNPTSAQEKLIKTTATAMYGGASDTTASAAWSFMLGMVLNQEAQAKAQKEIDSVTGRTRLPKMTDRSQMPYLSAVVWETFRWAPPVPVTLPHRSRFEDEYEGYRIEKDDTLIASLWAITREEEYHSDPETFDPDRYFGDREERTPYYVFGYGHRRCPGADMAFAQLFHQAAYMLSMFDIRPEVDEKGHPLLPKAAFVGEMVRHPVPFKCVITPRSKDSHLLLEADDI